MDEIFIRAVRVVVLGPCIWSHCPCWFD